MKRLLLLLFALILAAPAHAAVDPNNMFYGLTLPGFFPGQDAKGNPKPINLYLCRSQGKWVAATATATNKGKPVWNTALMLVDPSGLVVENNRIKGEAIVTLVPDPWVPSDQVVRTARVKLDAQIVENPAGDPPANAKGTWSATIEGDAKTLEAAELAPKTEGTITGGLASYAPAPIEEASFDLMLYGFVPGKTDDPFQRRRGLSIGYKNGSAVSARIGAVDIRHRTYDLTPVETPDRWNVTPETFDGHIRFSADTLDGDEAVFDLEIKGNRVAGWLVGTYSGTYAVDGGAAQPISGYLRGNLNKTAHVDDRAQDDRPWFIEVKDHPPVAAGEHPRLFFRKKDLPELRRRAETADGKIIVKRLRELLNGSDGESMPKEYSTATKAYDKEPKLGPGAFTISHAAGYGFLYQLTGDAKYAEFAKQCVEKLFEGVRSSDDRYAWVAPGGELRAGPSIGWTAVAYDLCYDAWPDDFQKKVALSIQNYADQLGGEWNNPESITLREMVLTPRQGPGSNHYGAVVGGCGLAVLAIKGDPGTDDALLDKYINVLERNVVRHLSAGWGDGGYYNEGWGASRVGTQGGFLSFLQALKVARGKDYLNVERTNASYITMVPRSLMVLGPPAYFPYRSNMGPTYGNPEIGKMDQRAGFSHGGYFSEGFGAVADRYKPALLWTYNHQFKDDPFDLASPYPHRAMLALINWPTFEGITEKNPANVLPLVTRDTTYEYFVFRNRFQDADDIVTTIFVNNTNNTKPRDIMVWGCGGLRLSMGEHPRGTKVTDFRAGVDGSGLLAFGDFAMAVDHSRASGADAVVITVNNEVKLPAKIPDRARFSSHTLGTAKINVLTLSTTQTHPEIKASADHLSIGGQEVRFDNGKLQLKVFTKRQEKE